MPETAALRRSRAAGNWVLLSFGHGYCAQALSRLLHRQGGWTIYGTTRSERDRATVIDSGAEHRIWPSHSLADELAEATHLLISTPPGDTGDPVLAQYGEQLAACGNRFSWVGYLSTTAVYGDRNGGWVDEAAPLTPSTSRGKRRVMAEQGWRNLCRRSAVPAHIFRLAGIYGPDRGPLAQIRSGKKKRQVVKTGQVFNRIHVDDIARSLFASMMNPDPGAVYNLSDNCPAPPEEVADYAAQLLGVPPLPRVSFADAELSPVARSFYGESKRVDNSRLKDELKVSLLHPDYKSGLRSLV